MQADPNAPDLDGGSKSPAVDEGEEEEAGKTEKDWIDRFFGAVASFYRAYRKIINMLIFIAVVVAFFVYFGFALACRFGDEGSVRLVGVRSSRKLE